MDNKTGIARLMFCPLAIMSAILNVLGRINLMSLIGRIKTQN